MLRYTPVVKHEASDSATSKPDKKPITVRLDRTAYDGLFSAFTEEYGLTDLAAGEILILYALPRRYEAMEEFTRERRRKAAEPQID